MIPLIINVKDQFVVKRKVMKFPDKLFMQPANTDQYFFFIQEVIWIKKQSLDF